MIGVFLSGSITLPMYSLYIVKHHKRLLSQDFLHQTLLILFLGNPSQMVN